MKTKIASYTLALTVITGCGGGMKIPDASIDYAVVTVENTQSTLHITYPATIKGKQDIDIRPKIAGFITKLCVDEGAFVRKGQPLFLLDKVQFEAAVKAAKAAVSVAEANVATQRLTVSNKEELNKRQIISSYDLQMAKNLLASYEANLVQAKASLTNALNDLSYTTITSPADGVVGELPYRVGSLVSSSSSQPLTTVSNITEMYVYFSLTEKQFLELTREKAGLAAAIENMPAVNLLLADGSEYDYPGKVETVSGVIDQTTGSVQIRATFPNPDRQLRSGGTANVLIPQINTQAIRVPQAATFEIQDKTFVYVVTADNTVKAVEIQKENQNDGKSFIVTGGLKAGQRIVIEGVNTLKNDMKINPITPAQSDANRHKAEKARAEFANS